ncbi:MAG: hypothetical protein COX57_13685 [Alphaproteobacteria bacterium CG_4_10_14_0_2_um_filter_63_37]|nr:MAG: hypothetical protein AUJ55_01925 [Proteobacteria bacterium CG1_02_64_396]PJA23446.1 MAG: hypothetical protein COX57_13685 [Alphaproteobacteria bacterium CG_4_10_14_0_2_um_filter_63_37]
MAAWTRETLLQAIQEGRSDFHNEDFSWADLSDLEFSGVDFSYATWLKVNFTGTTFRNCDMHEIYIVEPMGGGAVFEDCNLERAFFQRAIMVGACFERVQAPGSKMLISRLNECQFIDADLRGISLIDSEMERTQWRNVTMTHAILRGADLSDSSFVVVTAERADMRKARLTGSTFDRFRADHCLIYGKRPWDGVRDGRDYADLLPLFQED